MNPNLVFAGVYILVLGGLIALVSALLGPTLVGPTQGGLVIGGLALQAVGVALAIIGTWVPGARLVVPGTPAAVFTLFTAFAFAVMGVAAFFSITFNPFGIVALIAVILVGLFMAQLMLRV